MHGMGILTGYRVILELTFRFCYIQAPTTEDEAEAQRRLTTSQQLTSTKWQGRPPNTTSNYATVHKEWRIFCRDTLQDTDDRAVVTASRLERYCLYLRSHRKRKSGKHKGEAIVWNTANMHVSALR